MRRSAGLLLYRWAPALEVLLVHPGGPWFAHRDEWGLPKGEYDGTETPLEAALREFVEETGFAVPPGEPVPLGEIRQKGGKLVEAWALEGDADPQALVSNTFTLFWRGRVQEFPEVDAARWFPVEQARTAIITSQLPFLDRLEAALPAL